MPDAQTPSNTDESLDVDVSAFLANLTGEEDPAKRQQANAPEGNEEAPETSTEGTGEEAGNEGEKPKEGEEDSNAETDPDDQEFEIKVGDKVEKAKLKDLKRLFGQEAALTQKSQKVADQGRAAEAKFNTATATLTKLLEAAQTDYAQYKDLDFLALSMNPAFQQDPETFAALRADAQRAEAQVRFLETELDGLLQQHAQESQAAYREAATECIKVLSDPQTGIAGWGKPMYDEMVQFAGQHGLTELPQVTNPGAYKIVHMAMQWAKHEASRKAAEGKVQAAVNKPTTTLKPNASKAPNKTTKDSAMSKLRRTGDQDDAVDAFLASF